MLSMLRMLRLLRILRILRILRAFSILRLLRVLSMHRLLRILRILRAFTMALRLFFLSHPDSFSCLTNFKTMLTPRFLNWFASAFDVSIEYQVHKGGQHHDRGS